MMCREMLNDQEHCHREHKPQRKVREAFVLDEQRNETEREPYGDVDGNVEMNFSAPSLKGRSWSSA